MPEMPEMPEVPETHEAPEMPEKAVQTETPGPGQAAASGLARVSAGNQTIRFIHAADLHLDAAFSGMARDVSPEVARRLHQATFAALEHLFLLCERVRPDFLLLAGDIYNQEDYSLRAQHAVRDGCARLAQLGIHVCIVHGNHDPLGSRLKTLIWPDAVHVFGDQPETHLIMRDGCPLALVHGVSHAGPRESRNLAASMARTADPCLQIGLLHTTLNTGGEAGAADGTGRYAPCTVGDLTASGLDYWALGHIHDRRVVCEVPLAQYPGSLQGLHVGEEGPHGCLVVTASPRNGDSGSSGGDGFDFASQFQPLGPVEWRTLTIEASENTEDADLDGSTEIGGLDGLEAAVRTAISAAVHQAVTGRGRGACLVLPCTALIVRLRIVGRSGLDAMLRRPAVVADFLERVRGDLSGEPLVWIKDLVVETRPLIDRARIRTRDDLLGEILRMTEQVRGEGPELMALTALGEAALADLYAHTRARKVLQQPDADELRALLDSAEALCLDLLEQV